MQKPFFIFVGIFLFIVGVVFGWNLSLVINTNVFAVVASESAPSYIASSIQGTSQDNEQGTFLKISKDEIPDYVMAKAYGSNRNNRLSPSVNPSASPALSVFPAPLVSNSPTSMPSPFFSAQPDASLSANTGSLLFSPDFALAEGGSMEESISPFWWVNSGAYLYAKQGIGSTVQGELPASDQWRLAYAVSNPEDTDDGFHPQNIFRLVQRSKWQSFSQQAYFRINRLNMSNSLNRNVSNGLLFFSRYQNGDNLYYAGMRVDGGVVLKKKQSGEYYTMAYKQYFPGPVYDRVKNANLLPVGTWLGLKVETRNEPDGSVTLNLFMDVGKTGQWTLALHAKDDGSAFGGPAITEPGYAGIRTDFLDAEFRDMAIIGL